MPPTLASHPKHFHPSHCTFPLRKLARPTHPSFQPQLQPSLTCPSFPSFTSTNPHVSPAQLDWEKRVASIETLPGLVADLAAANLLEELLPKFGSPLTAQLSDLRSATVRAVCAVLAALVAHLGSGLAPLVPGVLPQLLKNHFVSVKAISNISSSTVLALMAAAPSQPAHDIIIAHCRDSHHQTRRGSVECLTQQLRSDATEPTGAAALQHALEKLGPLFGALKAVTADADAAVRTAAGKCFWALHAQRPNESGDFMAKLDPAQQKMLKRCQPK